MSGRPAGEEQFMRLALRLARRGEGFVSPNPMVGAVLVRDGHVVATGYHRAVGRDHAEVEALRRVDFHAEGCDLYVNLEPCCHHGRTPPCTDAILRSRVRRVFVAVRDSNPLVSGRGIETLRSHGIEVHVGLLEREARRLNEAFFHFITTGTPFVTLKLAATLDARIAERSGRARWITGEASRRLVHRVRARSDAVIVGAGTALADDPLLWPVSVGARARRPLRVVVDEQAGLAPESQLARTARESPVLVACTEAAPAENRARLQALGVEVVVLPDEEGLVSLTALLRHLGARSCENGLVEGGSRLAAGFLKKRLVQRLLLFYAPMLLADPEAFPLCGDLGLRTLDEAMRTTVRAVRRIGPDLMVECMLNPDDPPTR